MFQALEEKEREIVINAMEEKTFKAGENVIKQGDDGDVLYVVESGTLDCTKLFAGKSEPTYLKTYQPGEIFGELSLLYNCPRAANIIAKEDSTLYTLDRECFNHIVKDAAIKKRERYMDFLQKVNLLETLDDYERSKICDCLQSQKYTPEQYIIREGESGNRFFFIEEGKAVATKKNASGDEEVVYDYN
jgi:cAMP-dependent protein kinase regulator